MLPDAPDLTSSVLSRSQYTQLYTALRNAFPERADLVQLARFGFGEALGTIVAEGAGESMVFALMEWAAAQGQLVALWITAIQLRPDHLMLRGVLTQLGVELPPIPDPADAIPISSVAAAPFRVPFLANPLFLGRDTDLARLHAGLETGAPVALVGLGGIGKTGLAVEYAYRYRAAYPGGIFWLNMIDAAGIRSEVVTCAGPDGLNLPGWDDPARFEANCRAVLAAWQGPLVRLLIFDNLEDPALLGEWQPKGGGCRVLITSRRTTWTATTGVHPLPLAPLARAASIDLLLAPRARSQSTTVAALLAAQPASGTPVPAADAICEVLGGLPLALALAGAYLGAAPSVHLNTYQGLLAMRLLDPTLDLPPEEGLPTGHILSLPATFALSYDRLDLVHPANTLARTLLHCAAACAPIPIPRRLLLRAADLDPDDPNIEATAAPALARLAVLGLLETLPSGSVRLHRLVAAYIRTRTADPVADDSAVEDALIIELEAVGAAGYPLAGVPYLEHARHLAPCATPRAADGATDLLSNLGSLLLSLGDFASARPFLEHALANYEQAFGPTHRWTAGSLNNLAILLQSVGDLGAARPFLERALTITEVTSGPSHPATATSLNNLASLLQDLGDLPAAHPLYERALAIHEAILGPTHPTTAISLNNLASLLQAQGDLVAARPLFERALAIRTAVLGPSHPTTARSLNNLASLLQDLGDLTTACPLFERALAIHEAVLGPSHPTTARSLNNLARLLQAQGNLAAALPLFERAGTIYEQVLGRDHPTTRAIRASLLTGSK